MIESEWSKQDYLQQLEALNEHAIVSISDVSGVIIHANDKFCEISGYAREELLSQDHRLLNSGTHPPEFFNEMWKTIKSGQRWKGLVCNRTKNGRLYWVNSTIVPILDNAGNIVRYVSIRTDVSPLIKAQIKVRQSEQDFRAIFNNLQDVFYRTDTAGHITLLSPSVENLLQYKANELIGSNFSDLLVEPEMRADFLRQLQENDGRIADYVIRIRGKEGQPVWVSVSSHFHIDHNDNIMGVEGIFRDISLQKQMELELIRAKEEADSANSAKSAFLASMSHELRTPLNAILGFSELLQVAAPDVDTKDNATHIYKAGRHLLKLINEVLDLSSIEAGKIEISMTSIDVSDIFHEAREVISPLAQRKGIEVDFINSDATLGVMADRNRLHQVVLNLISNAIKYNRPQGKVKVFTERRGDKVRISVSDTGIGMTPHDLESLFTPYARFGPSHIEGTGIGLTITKRLVEAMGGMIGVESIPDTGSIFWIEFRHASIGADHASAETQTDGNTSADMPTMNGTVLYIEDEHVNQEMMRKVLQRVSNLHLLSAEAPREGLTLAEAHLPDLILLDINMPEMDGFEVFERLRGNPVTRHIPVVALSANAMPEDLEKGKAAGFDDYLTKPVNIMSLQAAVQRYLKQKSA